MHYLSATLSLSLFWIVLSGHFSPLLLSVGAVSVALVVWLLWRMDSTDRQPNTLHPSLGLFAYLGWLLWEVVKANIDLAKRILHPSLPIEPTWTRLDVGLSTKLGKTLYANSITLTPGTLTTDVDEGHFMIHALSREGIESLRAGEMEEQIRKLGL
ncbi:MAG: Na+/H+ antiporter subunit E [Gammaproteobacteria bacterium]|nr:Na+/H+ antiporter subunit E [Gammaproteobacteria bacterium]